MDDKRAILADHVEDRVTVTGMFDKFSLYVSGLRQWRTALLQDVFVLIEGKDIDLGHMWVQHADPLKKPDLVYGDRVRCNCRVTAYKKRLRVPNKDGLMVIESYSLAWPTDIEIINRALRPDDPVVPPAAAQPTTDRPPATSQMSLLRELKDFATRAGGWDDLQQMIDLLRS
jgi:hypothetical protein